MSHPDLPAEQAYIDRAYERLEVVRAQVQAQLKEAFADRGGTFQSYTERDIRVRNSLSRLEKLQLGRDSLVFGRIDAAGSSHGTSGESPGATGTPESFHIGRMAVSDERHEPLVVDWRAPVAEPFYRATSAHPMDLLRRRHFLTEGSRVIDLEDELFFPHGDSEADNVERAAQSLGLSASNVLMATLERAHTGRMRDIVATVQGEQDEIIRAPLPGPLVVQGGPGTGKTAVALHRAAYLLYTHRFPLEGQGVLVVGPNLTFLRYIEQVLPSLGESGAELSTAAGLYRGTRASGSEPAEVARLKGDPRMARLLRRAVHQRQRALTKALRIPYGPAVLTLSPEASEEIVSSAKRRSGAHNQRRRLVEALLWKHLGAQVERRALRIDGPFEGSDGDGARSGSTAPHLQLGAVLRRQPEVAEALDRMWPRLSPEELLHDLLGAKPLIDLASRGVLDPAEAALLYRTRSASVKEVRWTPADIALLDEASWLLGPLGKQSPRTYGHIVVDESQDLTPMELRMVGRRSLSGSMTVVGDIAQATGPWAPRSWDEIMAHLPARRGWRQVSLSVSYRAPAEVMQLAARVLACALPGVAPPEPVRRTGHYPRFVVARAAAGGAGDALAAGDPLGSGVLGATVARTVLEEKAAVTCGRAGDDGSVGVIAPAGLLAEVRQGLEGAGVEFGEVGAGALDVPVSLLALADAKGLEFDVVVVVEPGLIAATQPHGMRGLYVALTRCTRRLAIVYQEGLPEPLK